MLALPDVSAAVERETPVYPCPVYDHQSGVALDFWPVGRLGRFTSELVDDLGVTGSP